MSGQHTGNRHTGARGMVRKLERVDAVAELEGGEEVGVRELAQEHTGTAMRTLVQMMRSPKSSPSQRIAAAKTILEFGHGRAAQSVEHIGDAGGLTINILKLTPGHDSEMLTLPMAEELLDAVSLARKGVPNEVHEQAGPEQREATDGLREAGRRGQFPGEGPRDGDG